MRGLALLAVLGLLLSGCLADDSGTDSDGDGLSDDYEERIGTDPDDPDTDDDGIPDDEDTTAGHDADGAPREYEREESEVTVEFDPMSLGYVAKRTITLRNDVVDIPSTVFTATESWGTMELHQWDEARYEVTVTFSARAQTEEEAREGLETMHAEHSDRIVGPGTVSVATTLDHDNWQQDPIVPGVQVGATYGRTSQFVAHYPRTDQETVVAAVSSGTVLLDGIEADRIVAQASSGDVTLQGASAQTVVAQASSGTLDVEAEAASVVMQASSGSITADITPTDSGTITASVSSGDVEITLPTDSDHGYDAQGAVSSGSVDITLADTESVGPQEDDHRHVRTNGYDDRTIRTVVAAQASSGTIDIHD